MRFAKLLDRLLARHLNISVKIVVYLARVAHSKKNLMKLADLFPDPGESGGRIVVVIVVVIARR